MPAVTFPTLGNKSGLSKVFLWQKRAEEEKLLCYFRTDHNWASEGVLEHRGVGQLRVKLRSVDSWEELGSRVAEARVAAGLTQEELAGAVNLGRTALAKIETGNRQLDSLELARIAEAVGRPLEWFVRQTPDS